MSTLEQKLFTYSKWLFLFVLLLSIALVSMLLVPQLLSNETTAPPEETPTQISVVNSNTGEEISNSDEFELVMTNTSQDVSYTITNPDAEAPILPGQYKLDISHTYYSTTATEVITVNDIEDQNIMIKVVPNTLTLNFTEPVSGEIEYNDEIYQVSETESFEIPQQIESGEQTYTLRLNGYQEETNTIEVNGLTTVEISVQG